MSKPTDEDLITLDALAAIAMHALISGVRDLNAGGDKPLTEPTVSHFADCAYAIAKAMIKRREQK